jgi:co-chaperonin GroES (HSP10)
MSRPEDYRDDSDLGWDEENDLPEGFFSDALPKPLYWRLLVMPVRPKRISKGGIVLAESTQEAQKYLNYIGKVIAKGSLAFTDKRINAEPNVPDVGQYIIYGRYAGQVITYKGIRMLIINDDEILATISSPEDLKVSI